METYLLKKTFHDHEHIEAIINKHKKWLEEYLSDKITLMTLYKQKKKKIGLLEYYYPQRSPTDKGSIKL